jgi:hypothetical protein
MSDFFFNDEILEHTEVLEQTEELEQIDNFEKNFEKNLKTLIVIKCNNLEFQLLNNIIDHAIIIHENKINMNSLYKNNQIKTDISSTSIRSYFIYEYYKNNNIELPEINCIDITLSKKKETILNIYYRLTNNNVELLYILMINNNFSIAKDIIKTLDDDIENDDIENDDTENDDIENDDIENDDTENDDTENDDTENDDTENDDTENDDTENDDTENDDTENDDTEFIDTENDDTEFIDTENDDTEFIDVGKYLLEHMRPIIITKSNGDHSAIRFFEISDESNKLINKIINKDINNVIVLKQFIDIENNFVNEFGGNKGQMEREVNCLLKLYKKPHFPTLLSVDKKNLEIYITFCGVPLNDNNIPKNWKEQIQEIIKLLDESNVWNNDMWQNNFIVHDNIIHLVDFGWGGSKEEFPFINITTNDINDSQNIFELLDHVYKRVVQRRFIFQNKILKK